MCNSGQNIELNICQILERINQCCLDNEELSSIRQQIESVQTWINTFEADLTTDSVVLSEAIDVFPINTPIQVVLEYLYETLQTITPSNKQEAIQFKEGGVNLGTSGTVDSINFIGDVEVTRIGNGLTVNVVGSATDLTVTNRTATTLDVTSSSGNDATIPSATTSLAGLISASDKTKLDGIQTGAEANVQSDWNVLDNTSDAFILNKPTIPSIAGLAPISYVDNQDALKQDLLVSGTNIKTINGNSLLGSGNLTIAGGGGGETNTASNIGVAGVGIFKQKTGVDLEFKKLNAGSNKVTITDDVANNEVDVDVVVANLTGIAQSQITNLTSDLALKAPIDSPTFTGTVGGITKSMVGLSNVDNTSDLNKPISTVTQSALDLKQDVLVSGTNIKTINSTSLLGSGNINIDLSVKQTNIQFQDEGVALGTSGTVDVINFTGASITASRTGNTVTIDVTGGGGGGATNLGYNASPTNGVVTSDTGTDATIPLADGTNAGLLAPAQFTKLSNISVTQPVDLDQLETDTTTNNAKVSNATHTGDATGATALTVVGINGTILSGLATGILKNTTGTGVPSIALAGDFPTLNQNTTGSAATLTTGRTISITGDLSYTSPSFDGSGNVTAAGTLATVNTNIGTFGSGTQIPQFVVNGKGLITSVSNITITPAASSITGAGDITKVDDTNVTLTLGGTPTGSVLNSVSFTLGWTGTLADGRIASASNWNSAYTNRITSLTTTGNSGASTLISNVLNIPNYTLAGLGGISLTSLSSTATGLTYTDTTGVFSLTSGYVIPTTTQETNWNTAYTNRITSLTTTGSSGAATLVSNVLNIPNYTLAGLGGQPLDADLTAIAALTGTSGFLKTNGAGTWTVDTNTYLTGNQSITLSGEASGSGTTGISVTLSNSAVIGKVLTGFTSTTGTILATDNILQAIQKLDGNLAAATAGGVSSVTGTTNRITSTGGSNPIIDISASYVGQSSITTLGTISTGVWQGTVVDELYGGTGISTYTTGDILYSSATNTLAKLPISTNGKVLTITAGIPSWETPTSGITDHTALSNLVWTSSSHTGTASRIAGFNGSGAASYYQIGVDLQGYDTTLNALASYNTNGVLTQTGADTFVGRSLQGTTDRITLADGDGVLGNPTIDISSNYVGQSSITTLGTITTGVWNGTAIGDGYISSASTWNLKQAGIQFQDEGSNLGTSNTVTGINFTGNGISASRVGNIITVDVGATSGVTNLTYTSSASNGIVVSDTGSDATIPAATTLIAGLMIPAQFDKLANITVTQAVDLDALESDTVANNAKITNATHTGDASGSTVLTLATVNSNVGSFGSATQVGTFTVNGKGLITAASNTNIAISSSQITDFSESVDDRVSSLIQNGTGITWNYDDVNNTLTPTVTLSQYTDELAQDAIGAMIDGSLVYVDGTPLLTRAALTGAITASQGSNTTSLGSFTLSQLNTAISDADVATGGGTATGTNTGDQTITLTSDVTGSGTGSFATTISNNVVSNAKLAQMGAHTFKGNNTGSTANAIDLSIAQMQAEFSVDDLITLSGVVEGNTTLGTFTGTTIPDNSTIKDALQSLETTLESNYTVTNRQNKIRIVSVNTTLSATTDGTVVFDTASTVATLPSPTNELILVVKNVSTGNITVTGHLDGVAAQTFTIASLESFRFHSNGVTWFIIS